MKKVVLTLAMILVAAAAFAQYGGPSARESGQQQVSRTLLGYVLAKGDDAPVPNAIVYLKNTKTLTVKTFITQQDGGYRFHALSPNVDYEVHAEMNGKSSDTKTLSSFDSRPETRINLRIDVK
jgi:hypothetical protein